MRHLSLITASALLALGACSTTAAPPALAGIGPGVAPPLYGEPERPGHLQVLVGTWGFDDSDLDPRERQYVGGLTFSYEDPANPIDFEMGVSRCIDDKGSGVDLTELFAGVRKTFRHVVDVPTAFGFQQRKPATVRSHREAPGDAVDMEYSICQQSAADIEELVLVDRRVIAHHTTRSTYPEDVAVHHHRLDIWAAWRAV